MSVTLEGLTEYGKLLQAIEQYYGAGSDQWATIATSSNISSTEWYEILSNTPGVDITLNQKGEIISYSVKDVWSTAGDAATSVIDSNAQSATLAQVETINLPANTTVSSGKVVAESGMKTVAGGTTVKTIVKDVALGIAAVSAGCQLGSLVSRIAYESDPQMWNRAGFAGLNPDTWASITSNKLGQDVINFVFGANTGTNTTQAYMSEDAFAYMASYMASIGAFDPNSSDAWIDDTSGLNMNHIPVPFKTTDGCGTLYGNIWTNYYTRGGSKPVYMAAFLETYDGDPSHLRDLALVAASEAPFIYGYNRSDTGLDYEDPAVEVTFNGKTFYVGWLSSNSAVGVNDLTGMFNICDYPLFIDKRSVAYILLYGDSEHMTGKEGISQQPGATLPVFTDPSNIAANLAYLKTLYPELWNDAIYNDVVQPDGSVKRIVYVPVGFPENITMPDATESERTDPEPTNSIDSDVKQGNTEITDTTPDEMLKKLIETITATNPSVIQDNPDKVGTEYPDTGTGTTPPLVVPTGSAEALYKVYNPTQGELNSFGGWLWSSNFVDQLLKVFNDPMQAIIGLHKIFATPSISGRANIKVGYLDSGVASNIVANQYTEVDCGNVSLNEYFGNALDYTHTDIYLYLPFIGIVALNPLDITRGTINVKYKVDVLTGACMASVNVTRDLNAGGQLYVYNGNCAVQYPLSSGSYIGIVASIATLAGNVAGAVLSGGVTAPMAIGASVGAISSARTKVEHSGSLSGNAGAMGIKKPYLIIRRPQTKIVGNYPDMYGGSNNVYTSLNAESGFVKVKYIHLENIPATDTELDDIVAKLHAGVVV